MQARYLLLGLTVCLACQSVATPTPSPVGEPTPTMPEGFVCEPSTFPGGAWDLAPATVWWVESELGEVWELSARVAGTADGWAGDYRLKLWLGGRSGPYAAGAAPACELVLPVLEVESLGQQEACPDCSEVWEVELSLEAAAAQIGKCPESAPFDAFVAEVAEHEEGLRPCSQLPPVEDRIFSDLTSWTAIFIPTAL